MANASSSNSLGERVPKLRFPGFEGEWDSELFSELFDFLSNNTLSRAELSETGTIRNIHYGDILVKYTDVINVDDEIIPFVSNASEGKVKCDMLRTGDVIIADTAEDDTVGKATEIINHNNKSVVSGLHTMPCRPNRDFISSFLGYYINSNAYHLQLYPYMQGTKVTSISKANIGKTLISFPSTNEQKKIVKLFNLIEKKILLQKRLVEFLKLYKRGLLAKLFPQKGESGPQYRFAGFTGDWEQRKFGDLADYKKGPFGSTLKKDIFVPRNETSIKVYEQQNAINKDWTLERYFITKEYAQKLSGFKVEGGDIIVSCAGTIGEIYELPMDAEPGIINQALMKIKVNESIVNKKMFMLLFVNMIDDFTRVHSNGSAIKNIPPFSDLKPMEVLIPKMEEQKKISEHITNLNHLITLHQGKQDAFIKTKDALLQQMFI